MNKRGGTPAPAREARSPTRTSFCEYEFIEERVAAGWPYSPKARACRFRIITSWAERVIAAAIDGSVLIDAVR